MGVWAGLKAVTGRYLKNDDPLAAAANSGAFLVWSSQPLYPVYVWFLVGRAAWPALLSWLSTPFFFAVPFIARRNALAGRIWFVVTGIFNTLVSLAGFGIHAGIAWFLVPCLIIAAGFFRRSEWRVAMGLSAMTLAATLLVRHLGPGLVEYGPEQCRALSYLNTWSAAVLSLYLAYAAVRAHRDDRT